MSFDFIYAFPAQFFGGFLGGLLASFIAIYIWERLNKPKLSIEVKKDSDIEKEPMLYNNYAIYHLDVKNEGKRAAIDCEAECRFLLPDNKDFSIKAKWDSKPEPISPHLKNNQYQLLFDPSKFHISETVNINPSSHQSFAILLKYDGEECCYPFSVHSYLPPFGKVQNKLPKGKFRVEVQVRHAHKDPVKATFEIENLGTDMRSIKITKLE